MNATLTSSQHDAVLTEAVLRHLARELAWLEGVRTALFDVRAGAASGDMAALERHQRDQQRLADEQLKLREDRMKLARVLAVRTATPDRASIGAYAARLTGTQRDAVVAQRRRVLQTAREVGVLGRGTFQLLRQTDAMVGSVLAAIIGVDADDGRYTATGRPHAAAGRALVEVRS